MQEHSLKGRVSVVTLILEGNIIAYDK